MPIYAFRCRECNCERESQSRDILPCSCGGVFRRVFHCNTVATHFEPGFNHSIGEFVTSPMDFYNKLKKKEEENSERTGAPHKYEVLDPYDVAQQRKQNEDGIAEQEQHHRDTGLYEKSGIGKPGGKVFS